MDITLNRHSDEIDDEHEYTYSQNKPCEDLRKLVEFLLKRCGVICGIRKGRGDLSHLRLHPGCSYNSFTAAIYDGRSHIDHVLPVAKRNLIAFERRIDLVYRN